MYNIYKLTCPNGKCYIGITSAEKLEQRWRYGYGYQKNQIMFDDIMTYGWKNWTKEILAVCHTKEEALYLEGVYIKEYNSCNSEYGYNKHENAKTLGKQTKHYIRCVETGELFPTQR